MHRRAASVAAEQRLAVPAYFRGADQWRALDDAAPTVGLAVLNPASGPGDRPDPDYAPLLGRDRSRGVALLGYVSTRYASRPRAEVEGEIERYFGWYGVDGIFLDEAATA